MPAWDIGIPTPCAHCSTMPASPTRGACRGIFTSSLAPSLQTGMMPLTPNNPNSVASIVQYGLSPTNLNNSVTGYQEARSRPEPAVSACTDDWLGCLAEPGAWVPLQQTRAVPCCCVRADLQPGLQQLRPQWGGRRLRAVRHELHLPDPPQRHHLQPEGRDHVRSSGTVQHKWSCCPCSSRGQT